MLTELRKNLATGLRAVADRMDPAATIAETAPFAFDPIFVGEGWKVRNPNSLPYNWSPRDLKWVATPLRGGERTITGDENKRRLASADVRLRGVEAFWKCWQSPELIPEELKDKLIFFDGDDDEVLLSPYGDRYSLYLYWLGDRWCWNCSRLVNERLANCVSASAH